MILNKHYFNYSCKNAFINFLHEFTNKNLIYQDVSSDAEDDNYSTNSRILIFLTRYSPCSLSATTNQNQYYWYCYYNS